MIDHEKQSVPTACELDDEIVLEIGLKIKKKIVNILR